jgi:hypothetical protein
VRRPGGRRAGAIDRAGEEPVAAQQVGERQHPEAGPGRPQEMPAIFVAFQLAPHGCFLLVSYRIPLIG